MTVSIKTAVARVLAKTAATAGAITPQAPAAIAQPQDTSWLKWDATPTTPVAGTPGATPAPEVPPVQTAPPAATGTDPVATPAPATTPAKPFDLGGFMGGIAAKAKTMLPPVAQKAVGAAEVAGNVVNKVTSMIPQGVKDLSAKAVGNLKGLDSYYHKAEDLESSPDYQAFQTANPGAAVPEAFKAVMGQRVTGALASNDPLQIGDVLGTLGRYSSEGNPNAEQAKALLGTALQDVNAQVAKLPPEQQAAYQEAFKNSTAVALLPPDAGLREGLKAMGADPVKLFTDEVTRKAVESTKAYQTYVAKVGEEKSTVGGLWDMFKDNPMNFLVPAGLLVATLFEGKIPKLLGALAAAYGGYNLYDRYKAISDPHDPAAGLLSSALQREAAKAQTDPNAKILADPVEAYAAIQADAAKAGGTPEVQKANADRAMQALKDTQMAVKLGMGNRITQRALDTGRGIINLVGGDASALNPPAPTPAPTALNP